MNEKKKPSAVKPATKIVKELKELTDADLDIAVGGEGHSSAARYDGEVSAARYDGGGFSSEDA